MQQSQAVQEEKQAAALQRVAELTQRRKDHQNFLVQKAKDVSQVVAAVAVLFLLNNSASRTDIFAEKIGSQHRENVTQNAATILISPQRANLRPPAQFP